MQQIRSKMIISRQFSRYFSPRFHSLKCQLRPCSSPSSCFLSTFGTIQALNWHKPGYVRHQKMPLNLFAIQRRDFSVSNGGLPEQIERKCQEWEHILQCEVEEKRKDERFNWSNFKLGFRDFLNGSNTSKLVLHTEQLNPEQQKHLFHFFPQHRMIEVCQAAGDTAKWPIKEEDGGGNLTGNLSRHWKDGNILVTIDRRLGWEEQTGLEKCKFDIRQRLDHKFQEDQMAFLKSRNSSWTQMPGYQAILTAFDCNGKESVTNYGPDPMGEVEHLQALDKSQKRALGAALNLKRPILAVHGPPGSGKTCVMAEYLNLLRKQGKRAIVVFHQAETFYNFLPIYCKLSGNNTDFLYLDLFDPEMAKKAIEEPAIRAFLERKSLHKFEEDFYKKLAMQNNVAYDGRRPLKDLKMKQKIWEARDGEERAHLEKHAIIFVKNSRSTMNMLARLGIGFDVAILDGANQMDECLSWWMTMPMAPCIRLFGDCNQGQPTASSQTARQLGLKSLLQRLDEQFPEEEGFINCHLTRQYRSNPAIQDWPNRVFYGRRAAETDKSVQNARLEDFVPAEGEKQRLATKLVTDPLVMVDLSRLEGEWRERMFEPKMGGKSSLNWGEAILVALHLASLFKHIPLLPPRQISYLTLYGAQRIKIADIFGAFFPQFRHQLGAICTDHYSTLDSQQFEVVLQSQVTPPPPQVTRALFHLKGAAFQMTRARRQFLYLAKREWLEGGSKEYRQLLATFEESGRIVGPNELLELKPGQFEAIRDGTKNFYWQNRRK